MRKVVVCVLILLMLVVPVSAQTSFVADQSQLLTQEQASALDEKLIVYHTDYGFTVAVVTVDSLEAQTIDAYAKAHYAESGYDNDCALLLICENEGQWYIYTSGLCAAVISDSEVARIGDSLMDDLQTGNYAAAFQSFADQCAEPVCEELDAQAAEAERVQNSQKKLVFLGMIVGLFVGLVIAVLLGIKAKTPRPSRAVREPEPGEEAQKDQK